MTAQSQTPVSLPDTKDFTVRGVSLLLRRLRARAPQGAGASPSSHRSTGGTRLSRPILNVCGAAAMTRVRPVIYFLVWARRQLVRRSAIVTNRRRRHTHALMLLTSKVEAKNKVIFRGKSYHKLRPLDDWENPTIDQNTSPSSASLNNESMTWAG